LFFNFSYKGDYRELNSDESAKTIDNEIESGALVYLRLRPVPNPSATYRISKERNVLITGPSSESSSSSSNKCNKEKHFSFSAVFDSEVDQKDIYDCCIGKRIECDEDFTVLAYGTSGSGKTFTLLGDDQKPGIIPRALENLFTLYSGSIYSLPALKLINGKISILEDDDILKETNFRKKAITSHSDENQNEHLVLQQIINLDHSFETQLIPGTSVFLWVSFVEIYNENVYDLLAPNTQQNLHNSAPKISRKNLKVVCNNGKVFIKDLRSVYVKNSNEALTLLRSGLQRRTYASTAVNANSSRSHCIFFVDVLKFHRIGVTEHVSTSYIERNSTNAIDLLLLLLEGFL